MKEQAHEDRSAWGYVNHTVALIRSATFSVLLDAMNST